MTDKEIVSMLLNRNIEISGKISNAVLDILRQCKESQQFRWKKKAVQKLTMDDIIIEEYESVQKAAVANNISNSQVSRACRGYDKGYICHGYRWRYIE